MNFATIDSTCLKRQVLERDVIKSFMCGDFLLHCLQATHLPRLHAFIHACEWERSEGMRSSKRFWEYLAVRWLYHYVTGIRQPLLNTDAGVCLWSEGCLGSLTHKEGTVVLAHERKGNFSSIGVDLERADSRAWHVISRVCSGSENRQLKHLSCHNSRVFYASLLFSAKEAVCKCLFAKVPLTAIVAEHVDEVKVVLRVHGKLYECYYLLLKRDGLPLLILTAVATQCEIG